MLLLHLLFFYKFLLLQQYPLGPLNQSDAQWGIGKSWDVKSLFSLGQQSSRDDVSKNTDSHCLTELRLGRVPCHKFHHICVCEMTKSDTKQNCINGIRIFQSEKAVYSRTRASLCKTAILKPHHLQSWTKYLEQNGIIQLNWTGEEKFDICFCMFFNCYWQSLSS